MANSRQSETIFSPSSKRPTKRTRSSITEHSFQDIASSPRGGSVTYVSGTNCHPCVGSLIKSMVPTDLRCLSLVRCAVQSAFENEHAHRARRFVSQYQFFVGELPQKLDRIRAKSFHKHAT